MADENRVKPAPSPCGRAPRRTQRRRDRLVAEWLAATLLGTMIWLAIRAPTEARAARAPDTQIVSPDTQIVLIDARIRGKLPITELNGDEAVLHALNRLGYGPRPGDIERIKRMGLERWIEEQLHPESIDDAALAARIERLPAAGMSAQALLNEYPQPEAAAKKIGITVDEYRKRMDALAHPPQGVAPAPNRLPQEVLNEAAQAKVLRAIYSERQLEQQLTDFWFNHFNIFANKDLDLWMVEPYERDAIRPHALGRFRDLLEATAKSPAMLFYLDNYLSADPSAFDRLKHAPPVRGRAGAQLPPVGPKRGLNENYGRELMELHTLGVDGGYTQKDVVEVARCFTGWTIRAPRENPEFYFDERVHDPGSKRVLGKEDQGRRDEGRRASARCADQGQAHGAAHCARTGAALRSRRAAGSPRGADGEDIREIARRPALETMRTMIYSPEFWSRESYRAKVKKPFELVVSTARALGADVDDATPLVGWIARIGEPLYQSLAPTGYSDKTQTWVNTGALLNRLNYAIALASNQVRGSAVELPPLLEQGCGGGPLPGDGSRDGGISGRSGVGGHAVDIAKGVRGSARAGRKERRRSQAGKPGHDYRIGSGRTGISTTLARRGCQFFRKTPSSKSTGAGSTWSPRHF